MGIMRTAAKWLFIICLPALLLSASISWAVNSQWLYQYGFDRYDVSRTTGLEQGELERAAADLGAVLPAPFAALSFLALPVIPELRLTDLGLVDVNAFELIQ